MNYKDRKLCRIILNVNPSLLEARCPESEIYAEKGVYCDGCELFETYSKFRKRSVQMLKDEVKNNADKRQI